MTNDDIRARLRIALVSSYATLRTRLTRRLGSADLATESLHEVWLKLHKGREQGDVIDPEAYLYRAALNTATDLYRSEQSARRIVEATEIFDEADETQNPERIASARSELAAVQRVLRTLTARQRDIFINAHSRDLSFQTLAEKYRISVRTVQFDFKVAVMAVARIRVP